MGHSVPARPVVSPCVSASSYRPFIPWRSPCRRWDTTGCREFDQSTISHRMVPLVTVAPTCAVRFLTVPLR
jgi:hypothetical protein